MCNTVSTSFHEVSTQQRPIEYFFKKRMIHLPKKVENHWSKRIQLNKWHLSNNWNDIYELIIALAPRVCDRIKICAESYAKLPRGFKWQIGKTFHANIWIRYVTARSLQRKHNSKPTIRHCASTCFPNPPLPVYTQRNDVGFASKLTSAHLWCN